MKSIVTRNYDGYKMISCELIKLAITPWQERVTITANRLIHFTQSAISRALTSDDVSMVVVKSAIRYYFRALMELL